MRSMRSACICILEVCVRIQLGWICRPYVSVHLLKPSNPNLQLSTSVSLFYLFNMSLF